MSVKVSFGETITKGRGAGMMVGKYRTSETNDTVLLIMLTHCCLNGAGYRGRDNILNDIYWQARNVERRIIFWRNRSPYFLKLKRCIKARLVLKARFRQFMTQDRMMNCMIDCHLKGKVETQD